MFATLLLAAEEVNVKAKNPILPEGKELLWGSISFIIVFALLAWKAWPAIKAGLQARQDRIRDDLHKAEQARMEAETSLDEYKRQLADARNDASQIIEEARLQADVVDTAFAQLVHHHDQFAVRHAVVAGEHDLLTLSLPDSLPHAFGEYGEPDELLVDLHAAIATEAQRDRDEDGCVDRA